MRTGAQGLFWCLVFVVLDAVQAVYLGGVLQVVDAFLLGALVFGLSAAGCIGWTVVQRPSELRLAWRSGRDLIGLNISAAGGWLAYFFAIQLIEPAVAFTIFSGIIPITAVAAWRCGFHGAQSSRNGIEALGHGVLMLGIFVLAATTLLGWSGFVRGGAAVAAAGLLFALVAGVLICFMLLYSARLDRVGVGPVAQFGLRFPLYIVLAIVGAWLGLDAKGPVPIADMLFAVAVGLAVLAFPIYAVQKAVSLTTTLTIGAVAAVGPLLVFLMQMVEGRVAYSDATSVGLAVYFAGAVLAAFGSVRAARGERVSGA